mgnify:CR=1 FL=1
MLYVEYANVASAATTSASATSEDISISVKSTGNKSVNLATYCIFLLLVRIDNVPSEYNSPLGLGTFATARFLYWSRLSGKVIPFI